MRNVLLSEKQFKVVETPNVIMMIQMCIDKNKEKIFGNNEN